MPRNESGGRDSCNHAFFLRYDEHGAKKNQRASQNLRDSQRLTEEKRRNDHGHERLDQRENGGLARGDPPKAPDEEQATQRPRTERPKEDDGHRMGGRR